MTNDNIVEHLLKMPEKIKEAKHERYSLILQKNQIVDELTYCESQIKEEILNEVDENNKKKYSNETSRKTEFEQRSKLDEKYSDILLKHSKIEAGIVGYNIEIEYLEELQRNLRVILNYNSTL